MTVAPRPIPLRPDPAARSRQGADAFVRAVVGHCLYAIEKPGGGVPKMIERLWPGEAGAAAALVTRAAQVPATITGSGWASQLAMTALPDFVSTLGPMSAGQQLLARGLALTFDNSSAIFIPGVTAAAAQATFVKEGDPIPVRQLTTAGVTLNPRALKVICTFTRDIFQHSLPNIEQLVAATLRESVSAALDAALLDTTAGDGTRPPGLLNGIAATGASALTIDTEAMFDDLGTLIGLVAPVAGAAPILIAASPKQAAAIKLREPNLGYEVFSTSGLAAGTVVVVASNALASALDPAPRLEASTEALLHMDTAPSPISTTTGAPFTSPMRSLYQSDSVGLRLILECGWGLRSATGLAYVTGAVW